MNLTKCWDCGKPAEEGYSYCSSCLEKARKRNKKRREKLKKLNLCRDCGKPVEKKHVYCPDCLKKNNAKITALRDGRKEKNLCEVCGEEPIYKSGRCRVCYQRLLERTLARRDSLRKSGLCIICSALVIPRKDGATPPYCLEHERKYYGRNRRVYWERRSAGLCPQCGEPVEKVDGKTLYAYCYACRLKRRERRTGVFKLSRRD